VHFSINLFQSSTLYPEDPERQRSACKEDTLFASYWLTGRSSTLCTIHTMPLFITTAVREDAVDITEYSACCELSYLHLVCLQAFPRHSEWSKVFDGASSDSDIDYCTTSPFLACHRNLKRHPWNLVEHYVIFFNKAAYSRREVPSNVCYIVNTFILHFLVST
jgi:hypothetical protein